LRLHLQPGLTLRRVRLPAAMNLDLDRLPADLLYAAEQDMWVRFEEGGIVLTGATHLVAGHGQFMLFTPRPVDTPVLRGRSLGVMETAKTAVAIHSPFTGRIVAANPDVERDVALVQKDPYGAGWLFRLRPTALDEERADLLDVHAYRAWLAPRLDRFRAPADDAPDQVFDPTRWL
jgi:glycine cleavage system H protein